MDLQPKQFEIFCGTGGVGKTTLATSRALFLAKQNSKVLLITIDPSKRLKELLELNESDAGDVKQVTIVQEDQPITFDALLMSPRKTLENMAKQSETPELKDNRILKILSRPHGGMNEILSVIELKKHYSSGKYETIILDTPPGSHFIDFLKSCNKIKAFFDKSFMDIFKHLRHGPADLAPTVMKRLMSSGVKKLIEYLKKVTGAEFIDDFIDAINILYYSKSEFLDAIDLQKEFQDKEKSSWFLVTSVEHSKYKEVLELKDHVKDYIHEDCYVCLNKSNIELWESVEIAKENIKTYKFKEVSIAKEKEIVRFVEKFFNNTITFAEVFEQSPLEHVKSLAKSW